jgi:hypothetical protein
MPKLWKNEQDFWNNAFTAVFLVLVIALIYYLKIQGRMINRIPLFDFFILAMATFRLIRIFVYDTVTGFIRRYLSEFSKGPRKTASDLLSCPWCTGIWAALVVVFLYFAVPFSWIFLLLLALAGTGTFIQLTIWKIGRE